MGREITIAIASMTVAATFGGCKLTQNSNRLDAALDPADELGASDVSILVPLQTSTTTTAATSVFGKAGTGMCNAPTLDLGGADPIMSNALWQDWAKDVLTAVLPLPTAPNAWVGGTPNVASTQALMRAAPDVDTPDDCPDPLGGAALVNDVSVLRQAATNVAVTQSLPSGACRYAHWHVVSARVEPCSYRATIVADNPASLDPARTPDLPTDACGGAELRLVVQPFVPDARNGYRSLDLAMHLFFKVDDVGALVQDLRSFRRVTKGVLAGKSGAGDQAVWYSDQKSMLLPHPGLREEMDCGGHPLGDGGDQALGPAGLEFRRLLTIYARQSHLFKVTWLTSDNSGANWSFGLRLVVPSGGKRQLRRLESFKVETFTAAAAHSGFPYSPFDQTMSTVSYFFNDGRSDATFTSDAGKAGLKELLDIANPDKTTLNLGGKFGASCASCHSRDQVERSVRQRSGLTHEQLGALAGTMTMRVPMWAPFKAIVDDRNGNNLRNFGYGPAMTFGISRRTLNETEATRVTINGFFGGAAPSSTGAAPPTAEVALTGPGPLSFPRDILPVLTSRCGYCHGLKRGPALLTQGGAEGVAGRIAVLISSDVLAAPHMPPGKVLPQAELDLLRRWSEQLKPAGAQKQP